jgi:hypothetical protein
MQFSARMFASEIPADSGAIAVNAAAPGMDFAAQCNQAGNPALPVLGIQQRLLPGARRVERPVLPRWGRKVGNVPLFRRFPESLSVQSIQRGTERLRRAIYGATAPITGGLGVGVP